LQKQARLGVVLVVVRFAGIVLVAIGGRVDTKSLEVVEDGVEILGYPVHATAEALRLRLQVVPGESKSQEKGLEGIFAGDRPDLSGAQAFNLKGAPPWIALRRIRRIDWFSKTQVHHMRSVVQLECRLPLCDHLSKCFGSPHNASLNAWLPS